jgi:uncharacterized membrane protein YqjE
LFLNCSENQSGKVEMIAVVIVAFVMVGLVCFVYVILWMKKRYPSEEAGIQMFRMWTDAPSDFNVQISASEKPIDFQVAVDQPIEIETKST